MAKAIRDSFLDLERHRQLLERNIQKLRKSLQHWQIWEAEYEGLKEDIVAAGPAPSRKELVSIGRHYDGNLVTPAEVEDILGIKILRSPNQVTNVLDRRIDYVSQNVKVLEKQIEAEENKLVQASIISTPEVRNEEGLVLTEIIEELDEEDNVVSRRTETQGSARGQLLELLEKAGVKDLLPTEDKYHQEEPVADRKLDSKTVKGKEVDENGPNSASSTLAAKSVLTKDEVKYDDKSQKPWAAKQPEELTKMYEQHGSGPQEPPFIPNNESSKDAALRKEMLEYSMSEVGAVVAELDLEEGSDHSTEDDDYDDLSSIDDDEDAHGRSTKQVVDENLHRVMLELEQRLGAKIIRNAGPNPHIQAGDGKTAEATLPHTRTERHLNSAQPSRTKGVRFAEELDISHAPQPLPSQNLQMRFSSQSPVGDIVEHVAPALEAVTTTTTPPQLASHFESSRVATARFHTSATIESNGSSDFTAPSIINTSILPHNASSSNLHGKTVADQIIERQVPITTPSEPDEFDPALLLEEAKTEYHRSRDRMIQKEGGFHRELDMETGILPLTEEEGGPKKISRFKAARLGRF